MPKMIGHSRSRLDAYDEPLPGDVLVSYSQAAVLHRAGITIRARLDTSDRGGPHSYAKRWYRWYAAPAEILACPAATAAMRARAHGPSL